MIIYKFSSSHCGPCRMLKPLWDAVVSEYTDNKNITFKEVVCDIDKENANLITTFNINQVPTILFLNDKMEVIDKIIGMTTKQVIKHLIEKHLVNE